MAAFTSLNLNLGPDANEKPAFVELGEKLWWLNRDQRGGVWINERNKKDQEHAETPEGGAAAASAEGGGAPVPTSDAALHASAPEGADVAKPEASAVLSAVRLLLKKTKTGFSAKTETLASELKQTPDELTAALVGAGLKVPERSKDKPVFVEHAGEIIWFNLSPKGDLWVNAKASKYASDDGKGRGKGRGRKKEDEVPEETPAAGVAEAAEPSGEPQPQSEDPAPPPSDEPPAAPAEAPVS